MTEITHRAIEANGIRIHLAEAGEGPLVVLCHGFPVSWYSWRWQLPALAEAGFRAVAPDMRGYARLPPRPELRGQIPLPLIPAIEGVQAAAVSPRGPRRTSKQARA